VLQSLPFSSGVRNSKAVGAYIESKCLRKLINIARVKNSEIPGTYLEDKCVDGLTTLLGSDVKRSFLREDPREKQEPALLGRCQRSMITVVERILGP
jgi:hypothetical protein